MLVHGVAWNGLASDGGTPVLRVEPEPGAFLEQEVGAGTFLGLKVQDGLWCLGHTKVQGPGQRTDVPCPARAPAERGRQCGACFARDDSRLMHDFHRGGAVPKGLRAYLMQPHWLYVATFAGGTTKIGTASAHRKWNRLAEQGAVQASYVAHADDGRVVRVLEDLVTQELGLVQQVRGASKAAALLEPRTGVELAALNRNHAAKVRALLEGVALDGFEVIEELWERPALAEDLCGSRPEELPAFRHLYPVGFDGGTHGLELRALCGSTALATLPGSEGAFVADLGSLKGRRVEFGDYRTAVPALQDALF